ncbi:MAG: 1-acyl-sn-glycerol-3-phosphate acyltransferase [Sulfurovum sp.]|nr:1-acyl-sn-glycerol-3-phosphate acyltransferase [Sulfurovum sp.]
MKIFAKIRFYWGVAVISFVSGALMIPAIFIAPKYKGSIIHTLNRLSMFLMGARFKQEGKMDLEADLYVMNHQGVIDIVGMEALQKNHLRWVAKKELFDVLWFGNLLRGGDMISLDRDNKVGLVKLMKDVKKSIEEKHRAVIIFPEGTRAKGQKLLPFKQGANIIAKKLGLKVQPIVVTGSKWILDQHERTGHGGTVHYKFLPVVNVEKAPDNWYKTIQEQMQKEIDNAATYHHRSR